MLKQLLDKEQDVGGCSSNPLGEADVTDVLVDPGVLRAQVRQQYRAVAFQSAAEFHLHTSRGPAARRGYPTEAVDRLPDAAVESFAGVGSPFGARRVDRPLLRRVRLPAPGPLTRGATHDD
jgi:hypothetical protein